MGKSRLRFVNWNLHGARVPGRATHAQQQRAWHHLAALDADIALLQEVEHAAIPGWVSDKWELAIGDSSHPNTSSWGSVIAAHKGLQLSPLPDLLQDRWLDLLYDYVIAGTVTHPQLGHLVVASVHAIARKVDGLLEKLNKPADYFAQEDLSPIELAGAGVWVCDIAFTALARNLGDKRFVVAGDWNNARLFDETQPENAPAAKLFFERAASSGWVECHALPEERTYFKKGTRPYQLDHVFCDPGTAESLLGCHVLADELATEVSDHAPMVTDFRV